MAGRAAWIMVVALIGLYIAYELLARIAQGDEEYHTVSRRHTFWRLPIYNYGLPKLSQQRIDTDQSEA